MEPVDFPEKNFTFTAPEDVKNCQDLHVYRGPDSNDLPLIISKWKLSEEEMKLIQETGHVFLQVVGYNTPPVSVYVQNPFVIEEEPSDHARN